MMLRCFFIVLSGCALLPAALPAAPTRVDADTGKALHRFDGLGCGAIFYEGHITSLAARNKADDQEALYDAMFKDVRTDYLHLMIRHDHEPSNDNDDPWSQAFQAEDFKYCDHTVAICQAALARRPGMQFFATLYTPPAWMKTNEDPSGGGEEKGTLKDGLELELAEFIWAFLDHMRERGITVQYLSIANEPDWKHTQPSYYLTPDAHAALFVKVADYLAEMARRNPQTPRPKLVAPNVLSAVDCAERYLPPLLRKAGEALDIVGTHDYDRRGDRWKTLTKAAKGRPVWGTEWCVNGEDHSPGLLRSAAEYWLAMSEAFNGGANVWMAYDWVYPPRPGGEALLHVEWGQSWQATKIYHGFRQFANLLEPGMHVIPSEVSGPGASGFSKPGIKACAFRAADGKRAVIHIANVQDEPAEVRVQIRGPASRFRRAWRTSADEDITLLPAPENTTGGAWEFPLPPRGMLTVETTGT